MTTAAYPKAKEVVTIALPVSAIVTMLAVVIQLYISPPRVQAQTILQIPEDLIRWRENVDRRLVDQDKVTHDLKDLLYQSLIDIQKQNTDIARTVARIEGKLSK